MTTDNSYIPFTPISSAGEIPTGEGRTFEVAGRLVAIFFDGESYHAMDDLCPHMGASLGSGPFVDGIVTCPWHAWRFQTCDGSWCDNPALKVDISQSESPITWSRCRCQKARQRNKSIYSLASMSSKTEGL